MVTDRLIQDTRLKLWCEALESGKYDRAQGRLCQYINNKPCFCVLGVAVEIYREFNPDDFEFEIKHEIDGSWPYRYYHFNDNRWGDANYLPYQVAQWYGITTTATLKRPFKLDGRLFYCLDRLNDRGWSFKALAGVIRSGRLERI